MTGSSPPAVLARAAKAYCGAGIFCRHFLAITRRFCCTVPSSLRAGVEDLWRYYYCCTAVLYAPKSRVPALRTSCTVGGSSVHCRGSRLRSMCWYSEESCDGDATVRGTRPAFLVMFLVPITAGRLLIRERRVADHYHFAVTHLTHHTNNAKKSNSPIYSVSGYTHLRSGIQIIMNIKTCFQGLQDIYSVKRSLK